jgi:N-acetylmuramoyl-L-alanine amidase
MAKMWHRFIIIMVLGVLLLAAPAYSATLMNIPASMKNPVAIQKVGFVLDKKYARLVINISEDTTFKTFTLGKPNRLVVDISGSKLPSALPRIDDGILVNNVRYGRPNNNTVRVVLDLEEPISIIDSVLKKSSRNFPQSQIIVSYTSKSGRMPYVNKNPSGKSAKMPASMQRQYKVKAPFGFPAFKPFSISTYAKAEKIAKNKPKPKKVRPKPKLVVVDAGHGGVDPGAIGKKGTREKDVTLKFVKKLKRILEKTGRYKVVLTRSTDKYLKLKNRVALAHKAKGDIFISIHADSHRKASTRGLSVYTISENRSKREAKKLLRKSKNRNVLNGVDLKNQSSEVRDVLIDLARRDTKNTSITFAEHVVKELGQEARLLRRPHRDASLAVLTGMEIPSVLIELGYLSNLYEEKQLRKDSYHIRLAGGIRDALDNYFGNKKK